MAQQRQLISSGSHWEPVIGYSRAVRVGNVVYVSGTIGADEHGKVAHDDPAAQTRRSLEIIKNALAQAGAQLEHVVRTRIFVTDIKRWEEVARAHGDMFGVIRPATTMVEVSALITGDALVEIEAEAVIP